MNQLRVDDIREYKVDGASRVEAVIDGEPLWFETRDVELEPAAEGFASAVLIPALAKQRAVVIDAGLDSVWRGKSRRIVSVLNEWWDYPEQVPVSARGAAPPRPPAGRSGTAMFFSGGVDSFHALKGGPAPDLLVLIWGFDYYLEEHERAAATQASLREVAHTVGAKPVFVRTNVRKHSLFQGVSWDRTHGGVLAAIAHFLSGHVDRVRIPTGLPNDLDAPWGSHPRLDPEWSSSHLAVERAGAELPRLQKIKDVATYPLAQKHLRVCLQDSNPQGNCSRCPRCMLVMLTLESVGMLRHCTAFSGQSELVERVRRMRRSRDRYETYDLLRRTVRFEPELDRALRDLVTRSRRDAHPLVQWRRQIVGQICLWLGLVEPGQRMR